MDLELHCKELWMPAGHGGNYAKCWQKWMWGRMVENTVCGHPLWWSLSIKYYSVDLKQSDVVELCMQFHKYCPTRTSFAATILCTSAVDFSIEVLGWNLEFHSKIAPTVWTILVADSERQCSVCMEDFQLEDVVRSLPCHHLFHTNCISPWLRLVYMLYVKFTYLGSFYLWCFHAVGWVTQRTSAIQEFVSYPKGSVLE